MPRKFLTSRAWRSDFRGPIDFSNGAVPAFFTGLLPEVRRLNRLREATKTSLVDEFTLLLAIGSDALGDVQMMPAGQISGVQSKVSATMLTTPLPLGGAPSILKLDPPDHKYLVANEVAHLHSAVRLGKASTRRWHPGLGTATIC